MRRMRTMNQFVPRTDYGEHLRYRWSPKHLQNGCVICGRLGELDEDLVLTVPGSSEPVSCPHQTDPADAGNYVLPTTARDYSDSSTANIAGHDDSVVGIPRTRL